MQNSRSFEPLHGYKRCNFDFELYGRIIKAKNEQASGKPEKQPQEHLSISNTVTNETKR